VWVKTRLGDMRKRHPPSERREQLHPEICELLPEHFPEELLETAYSLEVLHIGGVAWNYEDAIKAIHAFVGVQYAILGGDVYRKEDETLEL
jgi:hypothetical protein